MKNGEHKEENNKAEKKALQENVEHAKNGPEQITIEKKAYEDLLVKAAERDGFEDKCLRDRADFENARRRIEKDKLDFMRYANDSLVLEFLPIADSLEMAEKHIKEAKDFHAVREGVDMIHGQIQKFLKDVGVTRIKCVGEKFDPNLHEAIETEHADSKEDGVIIGELKPGYMLNERVVRPAMVKIVKRKDKKDEQAGKPK